MILPFAFALSCPLCHLKLGLLFNYCWNNFACIPTINLTYILYPHLRLYRQSNTSIQAYIQSSRIAQSGSNNDAPQYDIPGFTHSHIYLYIIYNHTSIYRNTCFNTFIESNNYNCSKWFVHPNDKPRDYWSNRSNKLIYLSILKTVNHTGIPKYPLHIRLERESAKETEIISNELILCHKTLHRPFPRIDANIIIQYIICSVLVFFIRFLFRRFCIKYIGIQMRYPII